MPGASSLHAAIDLGSNSFHMLVVREVSGSLQTVAKVKRKVRLAAGLNQDNQLSEEAMIRGWQCLHLFSEQIKALPETQIRVVATATLRIASNAQQFLVKALQILGVPVEVISGEEEARLIYQGVAQTTSGSHQRLVVDIGGGSTELVTGSGTQATSLFSLPMGCVTWLEKYFPSRYLTRENFDRAEQAAREMIRPVKQTLCQHGWKICVGASGTVQALQEIMLAQGMDEQITPGKLRQLRQRAIQCGKLEELDIEGLTLERALVFPSGLAILLAIFHELNISGMSLAGGALREGLIYGMLDMPVGQDIRMRTLASVQHRYGLDIAQANRVTALAVRFCRQLHDQWAFDEHAQQMLSSAAALHEIGLTISFRQAPQHAAYLLSQMELPGFTPAQKQLLAALLVNQQGNIDISRLAQQSILAPHQAERLCRLLRLAIIMCRQRSDEALTDIKMEATDDDLTLILPEGWLASHPLRTELLLQESHLQSNVYWPFNVR